MLRQHHFIQVLVLIMTLTAFGSPVDVQPTSIPIDAYTHANVMHRQIPATPPVVIPIPTTTSSYDYWWPYPPAGASTTTMAPSAQSTVVQPSSSLSAITSSSATSSSSVSSSSSLQPSSSSATASSDAVPTTQTALHPVHPKFKVYYLYPIFGVIGILVIALAAWIIHGCCTRKPRTRDHSDTYSILGGPRYIAVDEKVLRDVESGDVDAMREHQRRLELRNQEDGQFRWPSYDLCDHWNGQGREKDPFLRPPLPTAKSGSSKSTRTSNSKSTRKSRSTRTSTSTRTGLKPTRSHGRNNLLSPRSDATSLAFLELYSSEEESEGKANEIPWESLRHKSIKRGILEQVHKDGSWRDSVRAVAGSAFADKKRAGIGGGIGNLEKPDAMFRRSTGDTSSSLPSEAGDGGASTARATSTRTTTTYDEGEGRWLKGAGFRMITESPAPNPPTLLNAFGYGQDDVKSEDDEEDGDEDRFTPMPARLGQSHSRSNSRSSSPVKSKPSPIKPTTTTIVRANLGGTTPSVGRQFIHPRDVLPKSPPQIMSPPLESQLCFTPTAAATARMQKNLSAPKRAASKSSDGRTKLHSPHPSPLPIPKGLGGQTARTLVKRPPPSPPAGEEKELPFCPDSMEGGTKETLEEAMRTVEKIVEASWSARDLGRQGAGSLSPTGFGSRA